MICKDGKELVSIIMPTYNVEKYVEEAVHSILKQTYSNFELIIVDDCSTDSTYAILSRLASMDKRIKLFRNKENSKICKTLNRAYSYAKGSFIARMDGDDISIPTRIDSMMTFLDRNKQISLVGSNMITIDEDGKEIGRKRYLRTDKYIKKGNRYQPCVAHIWLARREIYETLNGYREVPYVEDWDFLLRGEVAGFMYANVDEFLYKCRLRNGNTGTTSGLEQRKAGNYVIRIHRRELVSKKNEFIYQEFMQQIQCNPREINRYNEGFSYLNTAIREKRKALPFFKNILKAMVKSHYIIKYLIDVSVIRILLIIETKIDN